jgi:translation initiation factor IF-2
MEAKRRDAAPIAVWPCRLKILACFAKRDPIILGCDILDGSLRVGTPLCVVKTDPSGKKETVSLGKVYVCVFWGGLANVGLIANLAVHRLKSTTNHSR